MSEKNVIVKKWEDSCHYYLVGCDENYHPFVYHKACAFVPEDWTKEEFLKANDWSMLKILDILRKIDRDLKSILLIDVE